MAGSLCRETAHGSQTAGTLDLDVYALAADPCQPDLALVAWLDAAVIFSLRMTACS
jgi:hypothetical protein